MSETIITKIKKQTEKGNIDNISRTKFYEHFYQRHPEIRWAFLAGFVSRNAGWNMTDLESKWFQTLLKRQNRTELFLTFERANWLIFADAFPQLLIYEWSKKLYKPHFHLLQAFGVSRFMQKEWNVFWKRRDEIRLCTALIINEQNLIQKPVIEHPYYKKHVFSTLTYYLQEQTHFSYIVFPTKTGELYGLYVRNFRDVNSRIWLGKQLAAILFHPEVHDMFVDFCLHIEHTGSRRDYHQFTEWRTHNTSPLLRLTYPIVAHYPEKKGDWYSGKNKKVRQFFRTVKETLPVERTEWLKQKQVELFYMTKLKSGFRLLN